MKKLCGHCDDPRTDSETGQLDAQHVYCPHCPHGTSAIFLRWRHRHGAGGYCHVCGVRVFEPKAENQPLLIQARKLGMIAFVPPAALAYGWEECLTS